MLWVPAELRVLLSRGLSQSTCLRVCKLAEDLNLSASEVLVRAGYSEDEHVYSAFAESCGVPFLPMGSFRPRTVNDTPLEFGHSAFGPMLLGLHNAQPVYLIAPQYSQFAAVRDHLRRHPGLARQIRITEPAGLVHARTVMNQPSTDLECRYPELSAKRKSVRRHLFGFALGCLAMAALLLFSAGIWFVALVAVLSVSCVICGVLRFLSAWRSLPTATRFDLPAAYRNPAIRWPDYTVLVPLYKEGDVVPGLVAAMARLDYPADRLQVLFLVESDDLETANALRQQNLPSHMELLIVPDGSPRTKPRALSYGLAQATGTYMTVFDAEDHPEADQLKKAAVLFSLLPKDLVCLQARLEIDNANESFVSRQFALEYATLFDQLLPWFFQQRLPFPLSGTSNHFRREALEQVGGWDRYNVTEDADLGIRLARFGYRTGVFPSRTFEEAPVRFQNWFAQRARWHKGWLQTICVHARDPKLVVDELGWRATAALAGFYGASFLLIAFHPVFVVLLAAYAGGLLDPPVAETVMETFFLWLSASAALVGYGGGVVAILTAAQRNRLRPRLTDALLLPLYWFLTGLAFYRAVYEFLRDPYHWNKTAHGGTQRDTQRRGEL